MNEINTYSEQKEEPKIQRLPWAGSGVSIEGDATAKQIMQAANLDWEVESRELFIPGRSADDYQSMMLVPTHKSVVKKDDNKLLGVVGAKWEIFQNHEIFSFMDDLHGMGMIRYSSAGSSKNGKIVWVQAEYDSVEILPGDQQKKQLLFVNAFDGSFSIRIGSTVLRIICMNMMVIAARESAKNGVSIRHTASMKDKLDAAKKALIQSQEATAQFDAFQKALTRLTMSQKMWQDFGRQLVPAPEEGKNKTRSDKARNTLLALATTGKGQDIPGVAGTGYAALNALTEFVNYERSARGRTDEEKQHGRFHSTVFGSGGKMISQGIDILNGYLVDHSIQI